MFRRQALALLLLITAISMCACHAGKEAYNTSELRAREQMLRDDLHQLRKGLDIYAAEQGFLPQSMDDLVKAGYIREIPYDPMTGGRDWKITIGENPNAKGRQGITDVHSASAVKSTEGSSYSDW